MENNTKENKFKKTLSKLWNYFTTYEKIWFSVILVLAVVFTFVFPETDDPTFDVSLKKSSYLMTTGQYDTLDFSDTQGDFVICNIIINDEEYSIGKYSEYTVSGEDLDTLKISLPKNVTPEDEIVVNCYQDGEDGQLCLAITNEQSSLVLYRSQISLEDDGDAYTVKEIPAFYVSVQVIMILYLLDVILNILCELLISKQSKWNFVVSLGVEVVEILVCIFCAYRFVTMAVTLFFWIPIDIISFINWNRHKDNDQQELTIVRKLNWWQDIIVVAAIVVWTMGIGYLLTFVDVPGGIFGSNLLFKNIVCYLDACASAVGIANGLFILFRYREQWIAWYICALIETVINIMAGQWVLLVLKAGYFTNTTYGYIKWTKYCKQKNTDSNLAAATNTQI